MTGGEEIEKIRMELATAKLYVDYTVKKGEEKRWGHGSRRILATLKELRGEKLKQDEKQNKKTPEIFAVPIYGN
jgi:hypothetical protein